MFQIKIKMERGATPKPPEPPDPGKATPESDTIFMT